MVLKRPFEIVVLYFLIEIVFIVESYSFGMIGPGNTSPSNRSMNDTTRTMSLTNDFEKNDKENSIFTKVISL